MKHINIPKQAQQAIDEFSQQLLNKDGEKIKAIKLYGSALSSNYRLKDSDIDLIVISDYKEINEDILDLETKVSLKYGVMLSVILNTSQELEETQKMGYSFGEEIQRGKVIYERN